MVTTYDEFKKGSADQARIDDRAGHEGRNWCSFGAVAGLSGGIIAALIGSVLTAITWFTGAEAVSSLVHTLGTILLFMTVPLLILGAHCLDLVEKHAKEARNSRLNEVDTYGRSQQGRENR